jgi:hypothetical protein
MSVSRSARREPGEQAVGADAKGPRCGVSTVAELVEVFMHKCGRSCRVFVSGDQDCYRLTPEVCAIDAGAEPP